MSAVGMFSSGHLIGQLATAENVEVQVFDRLTAVFAHIGDDAVSLVKSFGSGDLGNGREDGGNERGRIGTHLVSRGDMLLGNDENVGRCLGRDVTEGVDELVLVHLGRGNITR